MKSRLCCAFILVLLCAVAAGALVGCKGGEEEVKGLIRSASYESLEDFDLSSKTIGVITGTITDQKIEEAESRVVVYVDYTGREFDPRDSVDDLAKTIMLRNTDEFFCTYKEDPESTYNNHVRAVLKQ